MPDFLKLQLNIGLLIKFPSPNAYNLRRINSAKKDFLVSCTLATIVLCESWLENTGYALNATSSEI